VAATLPSPSSSPATELFASIAYERYFVGVAAFVSCP
jgi:hypothetical protein